MNCIQYKNGYKYQLQKTYSLQIDIIPEKEIVTEYIELDTKGKLIVKESYAWDGATATIRSLDSMRGSLVHDALYQLMRNNYLDHKIYRIQADKLLRKICLEDGMFWFRAWYFYWAVRLFADFASEPSHRKPILFAPKKCMK